MPRGLFAQLRRIEDAWHTRPGEVAGARPAEKLDSQFTEVSDSRSHRRAYAPANSFQELSIVPFRQ